MQFGFRPYYFTTHALLEIAEKIKQSCDSRKYSCGVFLDLQKVSDTENQDILLKKRKTIMGKEELQTTGFVHF